MGLSVIVDASGWVEETPVSAPGASVNFGINASISGDGLVLAVGDSSYIVDPPTDLRLGRVWIYDRVGGSWVERTGGHIDNTNNFATGGTNVNIQFGISIALSNDGSVVAVGAPSDYHESGTDWAEGTVSVYAWGGSSWSLRERIVEPDVTWDTPNQQFPGAYFGGGAWTSGVSLSSDGSVLAVSAYQWAGAADVSGNENGAIFTYDWGGSAYTPKRNRLEHPDGPLGVRNFGWAMALSSDGTVLSVVDDNIDATTLTFDDVTNSWVHRSAFDGIGVPDYLQLNSDGSRAFAGTFSTQKFYDWEGGTGWVEDTGFEALEPPVGVDPRRMGIDKTLTRAVFPDTSPDQFTYTSYGAGADSTCVVKEADYGIIGERCIEEAAPVIIAQPSQPSLPKPPSTGSTPSSGYYIDPCDQLYLAWQGAKQSGAPDSYVEGLYELYWEARRDGVCSF